MTNVLVRDSLVNLTLLQNQKLIQTPFGQTCVLETRAQNSEECEPSANDGKEELLGSLSSSFTLQASHSLLSPLHVIHRIVCESYRASMRLHGGVGHVLLMVEDRLKTAVRVAWIGSKGVLTIQ